MRRYLYWSIFGLALCFRLGYAVFFSPDRPLHIDEWGYYQVVNDYWLPGIDQNFNHHPPLYLLLILGIFKVFGVSFPALQIVQSILGALTVLLIIRIARQLSLDRAGLVAALIYAIYPGAVKMPSMVLAETFFTFLLALSALAFIKCCQAKTAKATLFYMALFSFIAGLTALTRSIALALPGLLVTYFISQSVITKRKPGLTIMAALLSAVVFGLVLLPWALRNHRMTGHFMASSTSSGITFFWHNTPMMWVPGSDYISPNIKLSDLPNFSVREKKPLPREAWHPLIKQIQNKYTGKQDNLERSKFYMNAGLKYLKNLSLYEIIKLESTKLWRLILPCHQFYNPLYDFIFISLLPFFLYGLYLMLFRTSLFPNNQYLILIIMLGYLGLITLVFGGMPRYRYPFDPYIFIIAAAGFFGYLNQTGKRLLLPIIWAGLNVGTMIFLLLL